MVDKTPEELLASFNADIQRLGRETDLSVADRTLMANRMGEVYNYLSMHRRKPSLSQVMMSQAAQTKRIADAFALDQKSMADHQSFLAACFETSEKYFRTIQAGGYAAFFALWTMVKGFLEPPWVGISAILMLISVTVFVVWELRRAWILTIAMQRHGALTSSNLEKFVENRKLRIWMKPPTIDELVVSRTTYLVLTIGPAAVAVGVLLVGLASHLGVLLT